ncbi:hypothetical protein GCM10010994_31370 [Chelatococcus reniformis]|uniref:GapR-like DNA-binding domain-containing protein n=1 Tax=Chelatococcus reniformis TaxID=1494448 RepID=A0A916XGP9_9HYPH|nr:hypothetical protein GCM10010994_31370 [Chelatococcus reniformis]
MPNIGGVAGDRLRSIIERIERLEQERAELAADVREIKAEAKSAGFDVKIINQMIKERKLSREERQEFAALCDLYRAAIGMLDGTPLGDAARHRLAKAPVKRPEDDGDDEEATPPADAPPPTGAMSEEELAAARQSGSDAAAHGQRVIDNPFVAGDPRRAAWDEGWCARSGSDGMDIPDAWRRKPKPKKGHDEAPGDKGQTP